MYQVKTVCLVQEPLIFLAYFLRYLLLNFKEISVLTFRPLRYFDNMWLVRGSSNKE